MKRSTRRRSRSPKRSKRSKSRSPKRSKKSKRKSSGKKRKLNQFFRMMMDAKKRNLPSFTYKGKTYHQKNKNGMVFYKK